MKISKILHTKIKQPSFGEKKAKINLHQKFPDLRYTSTSVKSGWVKLVKDG